MDLAQIMAEPNWHTKPSFILSIPPCFATPDDVNSYSTDDLGNKMEVVAVREAVDRYIGGLLLSNLADSTVEQYRAQLGRFVRWLEHQGIIHLHLLRDGPCRAYLYARAPGLKQSTIVGVRSAIHGFLVWARVNGAPVDPDRLPKVGAPKEDEIYRRYLSDREVERLFEYVRTAYRRERTLECARDMLLLALLFGAGLRIGEVASIRIGEISTRDREVYLPITKGSRPRYAELSGSVIAYARLYLKYRLKANTKRTEPLFLSIRRKAYSPSRLAYRVKEVGARAGVDDLTSRCGRRHCITRIAGVNVLAAQKQAGHKYLATTQVYIRDDRSMTRAVVRANDPLR